MNDASQWGFWSNCGQSKAAILDEWSSSRGTGVPVGSLKQFSSLTNSVSASQGRISSVDGVAFVQGRQVAEFWIKQFAKTDHSCQSRSSELACGWQTVIHYSLSTEVPGVQKDAHQNALLWRPKFGGGKGRLSPFAVRACLLVSVNSMASRLRQHGKEPSSCLPSHKATVTGGEHVSLKWENN